MLVLLVYGVWNAIPNHAAVALEQEGIRAFKAGEYRTAEKDLVAVLHREPRSVHARFGLACESFLTGHRSRAVLELTIALENGLPLGLVSDCGHHLELNRHVLTAKYGLTGAFAVPRIPGAGRYEDLLTSEPALTDADEAVRFLVGSCLSFRANLDGAGWYYAANATEVAAIEPEAKRLFLHCLGAKPLARLHCAARPTIECLLSNRIRRAYLIDRARLYRS